MADRDSRSAVPVHGGDERGLTVRREERERHAGSSSRLGSGLQNRPDGAAWRPQDQPLDLDLPDGEPLGASS